MLPFYINGIWLIGSERRSELSEICAELLLSHSCFNSSRGGRGNSSMYVHSFLQTWHGWRSNVFELGEWLPEQSTHSTAAPLLHGCLWWACGFWWKRLSKSFVWQNHRGEFTCLLWDTFWGLRKQLAGKREAATPEYSTTDSFHIRFISLVFWNGLSGA